MSDPTGHFFHDMIEGVVIWEDGARASSTPPIEVPAEAESVTGTPDGHGHVDPLQDAPEHSGLPGVEPHGIHAGENDVTIAVADHSHDATSAEAVDSSYGVDTTG